MQYRWFLLLSVVLLTACAQQQYVEDPADGTVVTSPMQDTALATEALVEVPYSPIAPSNQTTVNHQDVWQQLRDASYLQLPEKNPAVDKQIRFYADKQKFFNEVAKRAEPFLFHIMTELQRREMPVELALLPVIESGYNPAAQGNGPAGLWQMVPQTARNFGLTVKSGYDGRKDPLASTDAVLDYLQHLHDKLGNDWFNAVAAYNAGEAKIEQAVNRNKAKRLPTSFWHLKVAGKYTQSVPRWLAIVEIVRRPERYGIELPSIAATPQVGQSRIAALTDLREAARAAGISYAELQRLNPAFRHHIVPAGQSFPLVLPYQQVFTFEQQKGKLQPVKASELANISPSNRDSKPSVVKRHQVKAGESLGAIAARYKISVKALKTANNLRTDQLKVGQQLQLPGSMQAIAKQNAKSPSKQPDSAAVTKSRLHQVQSGDSLWLIADKYQVSVQALRKANQLNAKSQLTPGQQLKVPAPTGKSSAAKSTSRSKTHTIAKGDSLDKIARQYKISVKKLLQLNGIKADSKLMPGQRLQVTAAR